MSEHLSEYERNLPKATILLNSKGDMLPKEYQNEGLIQKTGKRYIQAVCHYKEEATGERSYITEFGKIHRMLFMTPDPQHLLS